LETVIGFLLIRTPFPRKDPDFLSSGLSKPAAYFATYFAKATKVRKATKARKASAPLNLGRCDRGVS
jgi:hypothetical protein